MYVPSNWRWRHWILFTFHKVSTHCIFLSSFSITLLESEKHTKIMIEKKKNGIFPKISNWYCVFELKLDVRSPKLPLTPNFSSVHSKTKKQWRLSTLLVVTTSTWQLWHHTFELEMTPLNFIYISQGFYPLYLLTKFQHHLTWIRKTYQEDLPLYVLAKHYPINWLPWQQ